ncbi:MAG: DNA ligase D [Bacteroidia bacterium]|nr:DNA ligase D [Bacteroidia bacterium]
MKLAEYKQKRDFKKTPEPTGGAPDKQKLIFVIQKHDATRLHYDFRLELNGVLVSWAVPKQPTADTSVKRLAIMVEDHPFDYRDFEGIIPSGYGAGTVMVWDTGTYEIAGMEGKTKRSQQIACKKGLAAGKLHFVLHGKKLKGEFALVRTKRNEAKEWLLFKVNSDDKHKTLKDETDKSVISGKNLEELSRGKVAKKPVKKAVSGKFSDTVEGSKTASFPSKISPMLATLVVEPFHNSEWKYEIKWDGYRTLAFCNAKEVSLKSRNDKSFNQKFPPIVTALKKLNLRAVLDGEVVAVDKTGKPDFGALQNWKSSGDGLLIFYVFDVLWFEGRSLTETPLEERRNLLKSILKFADPIRYSDSFDVNGIEFFEIVKNMGLEGVIAKKADSLYSPGIRSKEWLKIKANKREELVIGGYTLKKGSPNLFSSLLVGAYHKGKLIFKGKVGAGFSQSDQSQLIRKFKSKVQTTSAFANEGEIYKSSRFGSSVKKDSVVWLKPELVCEVSFTEMTTDGVMRHPSFQGMRIDKSAKDVKVEVLNKQEMAVKKSKVKSTKPRKPRSESKQLSLFKSDEENIVKSINGHNIKFTNLKKIFWPKGNLTKGDLLNYYDQISPYILPYLKNRPQSLNRHPNGVNGKSFFFKDVTDTAPEWLEKFKYVSETDRKLKHYLVAKNKASILYMANLGCIEMNPWHSRVESEDYPDYCIIDLDPGETKFAKVIDAANIVKDILDNWGIKGYPKTSGSTGIHIYIPLGAKYTYDQSKEFARVIATLVQQEMPRYTSIERTVKSRKGKMYIDFLQNRSHATVAAPYSLRPKPDATVSMPLDWSEVKQGLKIADFTIFNALERVEAIGDIFKPVLGKGINLNKIVNI